MRSGQTPVSWANVGNSRIPYRGPGKARYLFGYIMTVRQDGWTVNGSGSVCWSLFEGGWVWRVDPPYASLRSEQILMFPKGAKRAPVVKDR